MEEGEFSRKTLGIGLQINRGREAGTSTALGSLMRADEDVFKEPLHPREKVGLDMGSYCAVVFSTFLSNPTMRYLC